MPKSKYDEYGYECDPFGHRIDRPDPTPQKPREPTDSEKSRFLWDLMVGKAGYIGKEI